MNKKDISIPCDTCMIAEEVKQSKEPACCKWYMDNCVCGDKTVLDCTAYKPKDPNNAFNMNK